MGSKSSTKKALKNNIGKPVTCPYCNETFNSATSVKEVK